MSVLTKIFIILLVVMSTVLTSALVVFVNKQEDFNTRAKNAELALGREVTARRHAEAEVIAVRADRDRAENVAQQRATAWTKALEASEQRVVDLTGTIAGKDVEIAKAQAQTKDALVAVQVQSDIVKQKDASVDTLRAQIDKVSKDYSDVVVANSQKEQQLDGLNARYRNANENIVALEERIRDLQQQLAVAQAQGIAPGVRPAAPGQPGAARPGVAVAGADVPAIRGVVKDKKLIGGVPYATISVGSADNVAKGMRFRVMDRTNFLGYLTVDSVDPQEAAGRLDGPMIDRIVAGVEVRTQWQ